MGEKLIVSTQGRESSEKFQKAKLAISWTAGSDQMPRLRGHLGGT